jgi:hypothetical protein
VSANRLRRAREIAGLSATQAARLLGWDTLALEEHETGHERAARYPLSDGEWTKLADVYGCSVEWLQGDEMPPPPEDLIEALDRAGVEGHDRETVIEFAQMIRHLPPAGSAQDRLAAAERTRQALLEGIGQAKAARSAGVQPVSRVDAAVSVARKAAYVRSQGQTRNHHCHWPGCDKQVPPAMWGCEPHWFKLPKALRDRIWRTYAPGQEVDLTPSAEYLKVADDVQRWIREHGVTP